MPALDDTEAEKRKLAQIDQLRVTRPSVYTSNQADSPWDEWLGRLRAYIAPMIGPVRTVQLDSSIRAIQEGTYGGRNYVDGLRWINTLLHELRASLLEKTGGSGAIAVETGQHFEYFDGVKKLIESATTDLLIVDPYLDDTFLSSYAPFLKGSVTLRMLTSQGTHYARFLAAATALQKQHNAVSARTDKGHDRYIVVDGKTCHLSGASFKDGPKNSLTTLTEFAESAGTLIDLLEQRWKSATVAL